MPSGIETAYVFDVELFKSNRASLDCFCTNFRYCFRDFRRGRNSITLQSCSLAYGMIFLLSAIGFLLKLALRLLSVSYFFLLETLCFALGIL